MGSRFQDRLARYQQIRGQFEGTLGRKSGQGLAYRFVLAVPFCVQPALVLHRSIQPAILCFGKSCMASKPVLQLVDASQQEDHDLLLIVRNREFGYESAAAVLTERLGGFLVAIICTTGRLQQDDLQDVVQQTWVRAFSPGPEVFPSAAEFRSWLKQVARSRALDFLRKRRVGSLPETFETAEQESHENPRVQALELCMRELESVKPEFAAVVRGVCAGKPGQQLSQELGISVNTVYSRFDRSKLLLKDCIERRLA